MKKLRALKAGALFVLVCLASLGFALRMMAQSHSATLMNAISIGKEPILTKDKIAEALKDSTSFYRFPREVDLKVDGKEMPRMKVQYTFDPVLQKAMESLFQDYSPDYGAFVALDATTGRVLSMVSYSRDNTIRENLALRASFPSASVFKVVTAAAAIEGNNLSANSVIPFNGGFHTLYRRQILTSNITRWTRFMTLKEAFGRSINSVFGKLGAYNVGSDGLRRYAGRFGFNRKIAADIPIQEGKAPIPEDAWGLAETASGYTRDNTMSPLQGALIAASVANNGVMMEPYLVQSISRPDGTLTYVAKPTVGTVSVDPATAREIRTMMKETVTRGTSRGSFRGFFRKEFAFLDVGGKTGSLTGYDPRGKYDWFVGYADAGGNRKIAVAALTIHQKLWRVKSSYLARRAIENVFKGSFHAPGTVARQ